MIVVGTLPKPEPPHEAAGPVAIVEVGRMDSMLTGQGEGRLGRLPKLPLVVLDAAPLHEHEHEPRPAWIVRGFTHVRDVTRVGDVKCSGLSVVGGAVPMKPPAVGERIGLVLTLATAQEPPPMGTVLVCEEDSMTPHWRAAMTAGAMREARKLLAGTPLERLTDDAIRNGEGPIARAAREAGMTKALEAAELAMDAASLERVRSMVGLSVKLESLVAEAHELIAQGHAELLAAHAARLRGDARRKAYANAHGSMHQGHTKLEEAARLRATMTAEQLIGAAHDLGNVAGDAIGKAATEVAKREVAAAADEVFGQKKRPTRGDA